MNESGERSAREETTKPEPSRVRRLLRIGFRMIGVLCLAGIASLAWEYHQLSGNEDYLRRRYCSELGHVTAVEVISLGPEASTALASRFPGRSRYRHRLWSKETYLIHSRRTVRGRAAEKVANLWRQQAFLDGTAACHDPGYAVRFYFGPWRRTEITFCWTCDNAAIPVLWFESLLSFDAQGTNGLALLEALKSIAPPFDYTNAVLSSGELEAKLAAALGGGEGRWDFREWVNHSPQKADFLSGVVEGLRRAAPKEVEAALRLCADFKLTNAVPQIEPLLGHTNPAIRGTALSTLEQLKVPLRAEPLLSFLNSATHLQRQQALRLLIRRTSVDPARVLPEVERSVARYGRDAFDRYTRDTLTMETNRLPAWIPVVDRLRDAARPTRRGPVSDPQ